MNAYTIEFFANCPTNGIRVKYTLRIETPAATMLPAEQLVAVVESIEGGEPIFHEEVADRLASAFPGRHVLRAQHHGVDIETTRDGRAADGAEASGVEPAIVFDFDAERASAINVRMIGRVPLYLASGVDLPDGGQR